MPAGLTVFWLRGNGRSQTIARALHIGAIKAGYKAALRDDGSYKEPAEPIAAFYGFQKNMPRIMEEYVASGRCVVFVDMGYWQRHAGGRFAGYHKVAVNGRHPGEYLMSLGMDGRRLKRFGVRIAPWRKRGDHIILAGMSAKSAESHGYRPEEWERRAAREIRKHTNRKVIYRPKPSWRGAKPIPHAELQGRNVPISHALMGAHAVVTHHSNVAVDALVAGVPAFCIEGAAAPMSGQDLAQIEDPPMPDGREQWLANLAWCQWNVAEMRSGAMWRFLKDKGLIP